MTRENQMSNRWSRSELLLSVGLIIFIAAITYLPLIRSFGYYLDDWYILWGGNNFGPGVIAEYHQIDRPLMGYVYAINFAVLGNNPLNWQILTFLLRLSGAFAFFWTLRMLWPENRVATTSMAILFLVYPGFLQQPNANTYSNHIFSLTSAMLSIALTVKAALTDTRWKTGLYQFGSVIFAAMYLFYIENMVGLEVLRWAFLWLALEQSSNKTSHPLKQWALYISPTFMVLGLMIFWRAFIFESGRRSMSISSVVSAYSESPLHTLFRLFIETVRDLWETIFAAWFIPTYELTQISTYRNWTIAFILAFIAVALYIGYAYWSRKTDQAPSSGSRWGWILVFLGLVGTLSALFPVVMVGRQVHLDLVMNGFNRYTLQAIAGVSLFLMGLMTIGLKQKIWIWVCAFLIGTAVYTHFQNGIRYEKAWQYQRDLWWQLSWRAPDIADDTVLVPVLPAGFSFSEDYEIWAPANLIYRPGSQKVQIDGQILNQDTVDLIRRGTSDTAIIRGNISTERDFDNTLLVTITDELSCMKAIDGIRLEDNLEFPLVQLVYDRSRLERILLSGAETHLPPSDIFGPEPKHDWCYYYQAISLSRQLRDWNAAAAYADEAAALGFSPLNISEWLPVYEAYANTGRYQEAKQIAKILRSDKGLQTILCQQMSTPLDEDDYDDEYIYTTLCENP